MGEFSGLVRFLSSQIKLHYYIVCQFANGGLVVGEVLNMIEAAAMDDPVQMQTGFNALDECSDKSITK